MHIVYNWLVYVTYSICFFSSFLHFRTASYKARNHPSAQTCALFNDQLIGEWSHTFLPTCEEWGLPLLEYGTDTLKLPATCVLLLLLLLLLLKEVGSARLRESDLHPISLKTPVPQYQPIDRKKRNGKIVEDYSIGIERHRPIKKHWPGSWNPPVHEDYHSYNTELHDTPINYQENVPFL